MVQRNELNIDNLSKYSKELIMVIPFEYKEVFYEYKDMIKIEEYEHQDEHDDAAVASESAARGFSVGGPSGRAAGEHHAGRKRCEKHSHQIANLFFHSKILLSY